MAVSVVIVAAHAYEARAAASVGRGMAKEPWGRWTLHRGEMWDLPYAVIRCGPGKVAAAAAAQAAVQYLDPVVIISFGTASCLDLEVQRGTIMIASTVIDVALSELRDLPMEVRSAFAPDPEMTGHLLGVPGTLTSTLMCSEGSRVSPLWRPFLGLDPSERLIVDWESAAVAQVAEMWEIPWTAVKVVSDHGEEEHQRLRLLALAAKRPLQWGAEVIRRGYYAYAESRRATSEQVSEDEVSGDEVIEDEVIEDESNEDESNEDENDEAKES